MEVILYDRYNRAYIESIVLCSESDEGIAAKIKKGIPWYLKTLNGMPLVNLREAEKDKKIHDAIEYEDESDYVRTYVADLIGEEYTNWSYKTPCFVEAPTGSGKNTFVLQKIIPYAQSLGENVLILENRSALALKTKADVVKLKQIDCYSEKGIASQTHFGNTIVMTYQALAQKMKKKGFNDWVKAERISWLICDEVHFLDADALFNSDTQKLFESLVISFARARRIYISATPQIVFPLLLQEEVRHHKMVNFNSSIEKFAVGYYMPACYDKYSFTFFSSDTDILSEIESQKGYQIPEKWLILTESKKSGEKMCDKLNEEKIKASFVSAEGKMDIDAYKNIVEKETFAGTVLISTSVLINGINIKDRALKHIVISSVDKIDILQFVGRKRIIDGDDNVRIYLKVPTAERLAGRRARIGELISWLESMRKSADKKLKDSLLEDIKNDPTKLQLVHIQNEALEINYLAKDKLFRIQREQCVAIETIKSGRAYYAKHLLSFFGQEARYDASMWIDYVARDDSELIKFLDRNLNIFLYKRDDEKLQQGMQSQKSFYEELERLAKEEHPEKRCKATGMKTCNGLFEELNLKYEIRSKREPNEKTKHGSCDETVQYLEKII